MKAKKMAIALSALVFAQAVPGISLIKPEKASAKAETTHYTYKIATLDDLPNINKYPMIKEAEKKFNISFELIPIPWDSWDQKINTMVASGDTPEVLGWYDFKYGQYKQWAQQGVLKALPDMKKYPNYYKILSSKRVTNEVKINGKMYAIPKIMNSNPVNNIQTMMYAYRRDWALKMGYKWGQNQIVSYDEFIKYLKDVKEKDPGKVGNRLQGFDLADGWNDINWIMINWNPNFMNFVKEKGKWQLGTTLPNTLTGIKALQKMYLQGLLDKDFYSKKMEEGNNDFTSGTLAADMLNYNVDTIQKHIDLLKKSVKGFKDQDFGILTVKAPDGKVHAFEAQEYWAALAFSSKMDSKKLDRFLQFGDWMLAPAQTERTFFGEPGVDWKRVNGKIVVNWPKNSKTGAYEFTDKNGKEYIDKTKMVRKWFKLEGDDIWIKGNPFYRDYCKDIFLNALKNADKVGKVVVPINYKVDFYSSPNKDKYGNYATDTLTEVTKCIVMKGDPTSEWNNWLNSMKPKFDIVLKELNSGVK